MLVTIAASGCSSRNERSLSSASATNISPSPQAAPSPVSVSTPPIAYPGSRPEVSRMVASMAVVVVLPCVPATATVSLPSITEASADAR